MAIDPVLLLVEELRSAEAALNEVAKNHKRWSRDQHGNLLNLLLTKIKALQRELAQTAPTSVVGSAELLRLAAKRFSFSQSRFIARLHDIADNFSEGRRQGSDLVWLRAVEVAAREGVLGAVGTKVAPMFHMAIIGASRPVMVAESASLAQDNPAWRTVLSMPLEQLQS